MSEPDHLQFWVQIRSVAQSCPTLCNPMNCSTPGEGNGNPLQCSCLENPRDGGAWWAAICGVTQSRTRLKRLSSSSSGSSAVKNLPQRKGWGFNPWVRNVPWRRAWHPTPVFLPGESHGQRGAWWAAVHGVAKS